MNVLRLTAEQAAAYQARAARGFKSLELPTLVPGKMLAISSTPAAKPSKYRNRKTVVDGVTFDSKKEAGRYAELKLLRAGGRVRWFIAQAPFRLPGGTRYYADFLVVWADGRVTVEDVKSEATRKLQTYRVKRREVEHHYGIEIVEV